MTQRIIIPGPPGTGKTYRLINKYLKEEVNNYKTPLKRIGFFTFSRNAYEVAKRRAVKFFPKADWDEDLKYFSTLHAIGKNECGLETKTHLLDGKNWEGFKNYDTFAGTLNFNTYAKEDGSMVYGNDYYKLISLARCRKISLENQYRLQEHLQDISLRDLDYLNRCLIKYKKETGMFEFSDMISEFIEMIIIN